VLANHKLPPKESAMHWRLNQELYRLYTGG
jgi:hypothetical protein